MNSEDRIIKASIMTGITEMLIGLFMMVTGWHNWYYNNFHFFGVIGLGMFIYGSYHFYFKYIDTGETLWKKK